ncbi:hypothetical protein BKA66DRAFT_438294 [Pyrenochaeta sp. MPI-SDFR-AT-0127]|nr:hypothetical protein BKA66DRAFT_438294 [Pyrenochaeta sp. MPI-SDFR-AT-0127]
MFREWLDPVKDQYFYYKVQTKPQSVVNSTSNNASSNYGTEKSRDENEDRLPLLTRCQQDHRLNFPRLQGEPVPMASNEVNDQRRPNGKSLLPVGRTPNEPFSSSRTLATTSRTTSKKRSEMHEDPISPPLKRATRSPIDSSTQAEILQAYIKKKQQEELDLEAERRWDTRIDNQGNKVWFLTVSSKNTKLEILQIQTEKVSPTEIWHDQWVHMPAETRSRLFNDTFQNYYDAKSKY